MRKILVLLLLMWCIVPVSAAQIPRDLTDAIPDSARELLDDADKGDSFTSLNDGLSGLWNRTCKLLIVIVQDSLGGVILVLISMFLTFIAGPPFYFALWRRIASALPEAVSYLIRCPW